MMLYYMLYDGYFYWTFKKNMDDGYNPHKKNIRNLISTNLGVQVSAQLTVTRVRSRSSRR